MADGTVLNTGSGGDTIRTVAKTANSPQKTQMVMIDAGGGADGSSEVALTATTPYTQGAHPIPTQDTINGSRTYVTMTATLVTGVATSTLVTCTINRGGTTSSASSYTVTTGKTLRIQCLTATVKGSSTAAAVSGTVTLVTAASSIATTSPTVVVLDVPGTADTSAANDGTAVEIPIPDGLEIASTVQIAFVQKLSTTSSTVSVNLIGFEY